MKITELEEMRHAMNRLRAQASRGAEMWTDPVIRETNIVMDILARSKSDEKEDELVILRSDRENLHQRVRELRATITTLMAKLADLLDEDHFHDCEDIVRKAGIEAPASDAEPVIPTYGIRPANIKDGQGVEVLYSSGRWCSGMPEEHQLDRITHYRHRKETP